MRKTTMLMALLLPSIALAAPPSTTRDYVSGFVYLSQIAADDTVGNLLGLQINAGEQPDVPYQKALVFFGQHYVPDYGWADASGAGEVTIAANGLGGAHITGTIHIRPFMTDVLLPDFDLTLTVDVTLTGTGAVQSGTFHYADGGQQYSHVEFNALRLRQATIGGSATIDGNAATVSDGAIFGETSGVFDLVAQP